MDYKTVSRLGFDEFIEKRSRFIGYCKPVETQEQAVGFIEQIRSKHWDAKHNVYAYILRDGDIKRYSDDGEPQGTAGVPVLDIMQKMDITNAAVVVTRYFGGVLLGAGGLVRAYSHAAKIGIVAAEPIVMCLCDQCVLKCGYNQYDKIQTVILKRNGVIDKSIYTEDIKICFHIEQGTFNSINKKLAEVSSGEVQAYKTGEGYYTRKISNN